MAGGKKRSIMIRSLVLFVHVTGVLAMFAGLALEAFGVEPMEKATARMSGIGGALTVLSGVYLGARFGVLGADWMRASYAALGVMIVAGMLARRSDTLRHISLRVRTALGLAIVFLMIAKPGAAASIVVFGLAVGVSALVALPIGIKRPSRLASTGA
jgi:hypothetical protein